MTSKVLDTIKKDVFDVLFLGKIQICKFSKRKEFCRFQTHDRQLGLTPVQ